MTAAAIHQGAGGKAANQAVAAARLGGDVALLGCVGDDETGRSLVSGLAAEGISVEHVARTGETTTGAVILQRNDAGEKQAIVFPGANAALRVDAIDAAAPLLAAAQVVNAPVRKRVHRARRRARDGRTRPRVLPRLRASTDRLRRGPGCVPGNPSSREIRSGSGRRAWRHPAFRRERYRAAARRCTHCASSAGSTGFLRYASNPASRASNRSSGRPNAVSASIGVVRRASGRARTSRRNT